MRRVASLIVAVAVSAAPFTGAQTQGRVERKVVTKVAPAYPDLAKRMHVGGVVKMEVLIRANGSVKSVKVVGGNPVLIESATDAVRRWKFEPAPQDATEIVQLTFEAH